MSPPPVWISPPVVTLPKGWCTQSTHLPHYGTVDAKRQPFRARLLSAWWSEARRGVVLGRFVPTKASRGQIYSVERLRASPIGIFDFIRKPHRCTVGGRKKGWGERPGEIGRRRAPKLPDSLAGTTPSHRTPLAFFALIKSSCLRAASSTAILARGTPPLLCFRIFLMISPLQTRILLSFSPRPTPLCRCTPFDTYLFSSVSTFLAFFYIFATFQTLPLSLSPTAVQERASCPFLSISLEIRCFLLPLPLDTLPRLYRCARIHT